ncbi:MAG: D-lyxose/D-mannose family sugar isomerase [Anaerolineae bacterium]|nr:D-lyxose/D-mannose family sugar isomerase [Anaerolineae bacterium]
MKRSQINQIIKTADQFMRKHQFYLPPFAYWSANEWKQKGPECAEIVSNGLGWDITDFGSGNFEATGLFLFTLRNGSLSTSPSLTGKQYAEKIMISEPGQRTPMHFHWHKTEDIINRGGGKLVIELYNATPDGLLDQTKVHVSIDGVEKLFDAGEQIVLHPGESITLTPFLYHSFWGSEERVLIGEVSMVNDDETDNRFLDPVGRFPVIAEDEAPLFLLVSDYANYYRG